jgi:GT2 family glycosyltransferase
VAGDIHIFPRDAARPTTVELYEALFDFDQQRFLERGRFGVTANLFTYASVVREIGAFDGSLRSAGDRDWGCRVAAAGYRQLYAPTATVRHAARRSWRALLNKRLRVMGGHRDLARKRGRRTLGFAAALARQLVLRPLRASAAIRATRRSLPRAQKLKLLGLAVVLGWAEAFERIRLELGGQSLR